MGDFDFGMSDLWNTASSLDLPGEATSAFGQSGPVAATSSWWGDLGKSLSGGLEKFGEGAKEFGRGTSAALSPLSTVAGALRDPLQIGLGVGSFMTQQAGQRQAERLGKQAGRGLEMAQAAAAPAIAFGEKSIARAEVGQLPPEIKTQIDTWKQGAKQQARAWATHAGLGDSETLMMLENYIDQQGAGMAAQYLEEQEKMGLGALGTGGAAAGATGSQAAQQEGSLEAAIAQANQAIAQLFGGAAR